MALRPACRLGRFLRRLALDGPGSSVMGLRRVSAPLEPPGATAPLEPPGATAPLEPPGAAAPLEPPGAAAPPELRPLVVVAREVRVVPLRAPPRKSWRRSRAPVFLDHPATSSSPRPSPSWFLPGWPPARRRSSVPDAAAWFVAGRMLPPPGRPPRSTELLRTSAPCSTPGRCPPRLLPPLPASPRGWGSASRAGHSLKGAAPWG